MGSTSRFGISPALVREFEELATWRRAARVDILVVVDTEVATDLGDDSFGVGKVIELIRGTAVGCMQFHVDIALRSSDAPTVVAAPGVGEPKYLGFRFDMTIGAKRVLDAYEQVWCFGFKPGNDAGPDSNIALPGSLPASDGELAVLATWMKNKKGGVFATGDHDYLGASLCHRIPRVGTMRRWTNADGVPPIGGAGDPDTAERIDTLRPPAGFSGDLGNFPHQGDLTPQPIRWTPWQVVRTSVFVEKARPHPVLCHPTLGPIDVMPDHAHEGLCRDTGTVPLDGTYNFDGAGDQLEYPPATGGGARPEPLVIAYGSTLASPPQGFEKGPQPFRAAFPMISVYDGHLAGVGRVATDSTWHHWMNLNLAELQAEGGVNWDKISRYFINLAVWLSPPGYSTSCILRWVAASNFSVLGLQEYNRRLSDLALGELVRPELMRVYGPCWVTHLVFELLGDIDFRLVEELRKPAPPGCLTCPPFDLIERVILGGIVRESMEIAAGVRAGKKASVAHVERRLRASVAPTLVRFTDHLLADAAHTAERFGALAVRVRGSAKAD